MIFQLRLFQVKGASLPHSTFFILCLLGLARIFYSLFLPKRLFLDTIKMIELHCHQYSILLNSVVVLKLH